MRRTLQRLAGARAATQEPNHRQATAFLAECRKRLNQVNNHASLRGVEGAATSMYFSQMDKYLPRNMPFTLRSRRPPQNPVNALLSWTYAIVTAKICDAVHQADLDPALGFLHEPHLGRPALSLDLLEPLRAPLCDMLVMHLINHHILSQDDFSCLDNDEGVQLKKEAKRKFFEAYEKTMSRDFKASKNDMHTNFHNVIAKQTYQVCSFLEEGKIPVFFLMP